MRLLPDRTHPVTRGLLVITVASVGVAPVCAFADPIETSTIVERIQDLQHDVVWQPSAQGYAELSHLSILLHGRGVPSIDAEPALVLGLDAWFEGMRRMEAMSESAMPKSYLQPLDKAQLGLAEAIDGALPTDVDFGVEGYLRLAIRRESLAPATLDANKKAVLVEGITAQNWWERANLKKRLLDQEPGNVAFSLLAFRANEDIQNCQDTYATTGTGQVDVPLRADLALTLAKTDWGRRQAHRLRAGHDECVLTFASPPSPLNVANDLYNEAIIQIQPEDLADPATTRWITLAVVTARDVQVKNNDVDQLLVLGERLISPTFPDIQWPERGAAAFNIFRLVVQALAHEPHDRRSAASYAQLSRRLLVDEMAAIKIGYRHQQISDAQRAALVGLVSNTKALNELGDLKDAAKKDWALADRVGAVTLAAVLDLGRPPVDPSIPLPTSAPFVPHWPDMLGQLVADVYTLSDFVRNTASKRDGDTRGERFNNRWWTLDELADLVTKLEVRATLPGTLGQDANTSYLGALIAFGLAHAAAADAGTTQIVFQQIEQREAGLLDIPMLGGTLSPRQELDKWSTAIHPEVRPVLVRAPRDLDVTTARKAGAAPLKESARLTADHAWFLDGSSEEEWRVAFVPVADDVHLLVGTQEVALPAGDEHVVARLRFVGGAWRLEASPLPGILN